MTPICESHVGKPCGYCNKPMDRTKLGKQLFHVGVEKTDPDDRGRIYYQLPTAADKARLKAKGVGEDGLPLA